MGWWANEKQHRKWYPSETISVAIGQGPLIVTPLQVAVMMGAIANGGTVYRPHVLRLIEHTNPDGSVDLAAFVEAARHLYPLRRLRLLPNVGPAVLSIEHRAMGPSLTLVGGHTHAPIQNERYGIKYFNSGSWVDQHCTYITVGEDGVEIQNYTGSSDSLLPLEAEGHSEMGIHEEIEIPSHAFYRPVRG